jgi:hypothetical protein
MRLSHGYCVIGLVMAGVITAMATSMAHAAGPQAGEAGDNNSSDTNEIRHYQLTMDKAQQAATALQSINQLVASNPSLSAALDAGSESTGKKPITEQAQDVDTKFPQISAIIKQNGLATREFIVITGAIINDLSWVGLKKKGMIKDYPAGMITPENAALIEANWDAFQQIVAKMSPPSAN